MSSIAKNNTERNNFDIDELSKFITDRGGVSSHEIDGKTFIVSDRPPQDGELYVSRGQRGGDGLIVRRFLDGPGCRPDLLLGTVVLEIKPPQKSRNLDGEVIDGLQVEKLLGAIAAECEGQPYIIYGLFFIFSSIKLAIEAGSEFIAEDLSDTALRALFQETENINAGCERLTRSVARTWKSALEHGMFDVSNQSSVSSMFADDEIHFARLNGTAPDYMTQQEVKEVEV